MDADIGIGIFCVIILFVIIVYVLSKRESKISAEKEQESREQRRKSEMSRIERGIVQSNNFQKSIDYQAPDFKWSFAVDKQSKQWMLSFESSIGEQLFDTCVYPFSTLIGWDVSEDGNSIVSSNAGAALGAGLLFGTVGAVAASAGSREIQKSCSSLAIELTLNDTARARRTLPVIRSETPCDSYEYQRAIDLVKNITAELAYIKANAEKPKQPESKPQPPKIESPQPSESSEPDIYAQIEKLHALKEKGIITDEEFQKKKHSLLGI